MFSVTVTREDKVRASAVFPSLLEAQMACAVALAAAGAASPEQLAADIPHNVARKWWHLRGYTLTLEREES